MNVGYEVTKPSRKQVMFPIIVLAITLAIAGALFFTAKQVGKNEESETIFKAPGEQVISVSRPGEYEIDMAIETTFEGTTYSLPETFNGVKGILHLNDQEVELESLQNTVVYGKEGEKGKACFNFTAEEPGEYILTTTLDSNETDEVILVARRSDTQVGKIILLSTAACMIGLMGVLQFIAYMIFNLIKLGTYIYQTKH